MSEERQGELETAVVGAGGWLRIPGGDAARGRDPRPGDDRRRAPASVALHAVDGREADACWQLRADSPACAGEVLEARGVSRRYGEQVALDEFDVTFLPGELAVVVGPSGSGQVDATRAARGMDVPDEGEILLGASSCPRSTGPHAPRCVGSRIAVVGQAPGLSGFLSARENVELGLALRGLDATRRRNGRPLRWRRSVSRAHADTPRRTPLGRPAGARRARTRLCRARRPVVLADEPTSRLDAATTLEIGGLLAELAHVHRNDGRMRDARPAAHRPRRPRGAGARILAGSIGVMATATVQVTGVRCERCIGRLAGALRGHEGIEYANANLMGEVSLAWDDGEDLARGDRGRAPARSGFPEVASERE